MMKKSLAIVLAILMAVGCIMTVSAASGTTPGYKIVNVYNEAEGTVTCELYVKGGYGSVGQLGVYYDTELISLAADQGSGLAANYTNPKIDEIITTYNGTGYTVSATPETNKLSDLINEEEGEFFFAWFSGVSACVDAREEEKKILSFEFLINDGVELSDLNNSGEDLISFATDKPKSAGVKGYSSGVYCANENSVAFRNSAGAKNPIILAVEFDGIDVEAGVKKVTVKVENDDGAALEDVYVKVDTDEKQTDANGEAEFEIPKAQEGFSASVKYLEDDEYKVCSTNTNTLTAVLKKPEAPSKPTLAAGVKQIEVKWAEPDSDSAVTSYTVSYTKEGGSEETKSVTEGRSVILTDLAGDTKYSVKVCAVSALGTGAYSVAAETTTTSGGGGGGGGAGGAAEVTKYEITFVTNNGNATIPSVKVEKGKTLTKPADPAREGYVFGGWFTDSTLTKAYDFSAPVNSKFTLYAKWTAVDAVVTPPAVWVNPFTDVKESNWFYGDVKYVSENGLFNGITETTFEPSTNMNRAMLVTVLYRYVGQPAVATASPFSDVQAGKWFHDPVVWAYQNGIVTGTTDTTYSPTDNLTREQIAAIMYRFAKNYLKVDVSAKGEVSIFTDADRISGYAKESVEWAVGAGLLKGVTDTTLGPRNTATRAQVAAILHRFLENVAK